MAEAVDHSLAAFFFFHGEAVGFAGGDLDDVAERLHERRHDRARVLPAPFGSFGRGWEPELAGFVGPPRVHLAVLQAGENVVGAALEFNHRRGRGEHHRLGGRVAFGVAGPQLPFGVLAPGEHFFAAAPYRVGRFAAGRDPFHAAEGVSFELHPPGDRAAGHGRPGVGFPVTLFFFGAGLFDAEVAVLVFAPGHDFAAGEQREVAHPARRELHDVFEPGYLHGFVPRAGHERFAREGGAFEALFAVAPLSEFRGPPRPDAAVVAQRGGVGVGGRHFLDVFEVHHRPGAVLGLQVVAVAELLLVVGPPGDERAVAQQCDGELEAGLDGADVAEAEDLVGGSLVDAAKARRQLFGAVDPPLHRRAAAMTAGAAFAARLGGGAGEGEHRHQDRARPARRESNLQIALSRSWR